MERNRYWLPISKDWGGNHLGLDLDPDEQGRMGQVINFGRDEEVKYVVALSLRFIRFAWIMGCKIRLRG
ncbi:SMI1/KNR4 family protein [Brevibacillus centrosporus]|uniref:SMI1/KNR4 family protein n=1 Tax=Brevibacillus centrosporus TaxID=54910 RepID=UPI003825F5C2